jgi:hypothetical protein
MKVFKYLGGSIVNRAAPATALALIALIAAAAGCGGGSSSEQSPPLSKSAFIKKADAVCTESQKRIETGFTAFLAKNGIKEIGEKGESAKEAEAHTNEVIETIAIPQLRRQVEELSKLEAPADVETKVKAYISALEKEVKEGEKDPKSLTGPATSVFAESDAAAEGIGFKVCAVHN